MSSEFFLEGPEDEGMRRRAEAEADVTGPKSLRPDLRTGNSEEGETSD